MQKLKRISALAMAVVMCFALGITASAVDEGDYDTNLYVPGLPAGHNMDFFGEANVTTNEDGDSVVMIETQEAVVFGVSGRVTGAVVSDASAYSDYTVSFVTEDGLDYVKVVCDSDITAADFYVGITFTVTTDRGHNDATGYLSLVENAEA